MKIFHRWASLLSASLLVLSALSCASPSPGGDASSSPGGETTVTVSPEGPSESEETPSEDPLPAEASVMRLGFLDPEGRCIYVYGEKGDPDYSEADFTSLYAEYGRSFSIADVFEDPDTGLAYMDVSGKKIPLGLDFLSRAMVYNCMPGGDYPSEEDVCAAWWRYYVTRWNALLPEIPLCGETAVTLYREAVKGVDAYPVTPYRDLAGALLFWSTEGEQDRIILGSLESLSGHFRDPYSGAEILSSADLTVSRLTNGLSLVTLTEDGRPAWNRTVVHDHQERENEDGSLTYTITLWEDLRFSDGSPVTAKDYLAYPLAFLSAVGTQADPAFYGRSVFHFSGLDTFRFYEGGALPNEPKGVFSGIRLLDERTFALTVPASDLPDANALFSLCLTAQYAPMWLGEAEILDDGSGCYLSEDFYDRADDGSYLMAEHLKKSLEDPESFRSYPCSGPYSVLHYSGGTAESVILVRNEQYPGDPDGRKPSIGTVILKNVAWENVFSELVGGTLDVFTGITEAEDIREAAAFLETAGGSVKASRYALGNADVLHFRADLGPVQFLEVRQALAHLLDREALLTALQGGIGIIPDGPYTDHALYRAAVRDGMRLKHYSKSAAEAVLLLEEGGWIYNSKGGAYDSGIRYRKIPAELLDERNRTYAAQDGSVQCYEKDGFVYMPLVINFMAVKDSPVSGQLKEMLLGEDFRSAGMLVTVTEGSFQEATDELCQRPISGYYSGKPLFNAFGAFTEDYAEAPLDDSVRWSVDPQEYERFSQQYFRDPADMVWLK